MARKSKQATFDKICGELRAHSFAVVSRDSDDFLVSKNGVAAVLRDGGEGAVALRVAPGILVNGEVARLCDRGYQKFIKTSQGEIPASAAQLHRVHQFTEELNLLIGASSLYNESLGTTSDLYEYDRLKGH